MTKEKPKEKTPKEKPDWENFPKEEEEIVVDPNKIPRTKR